MKGLRVTLAFLITSFFMGFALALLSAYLVAHGEHAIPATTRLTMILGMSGVVAAISGTGGGNQRVAPAARSDEAAAKRCAPAADRATVYVFRDAFYGKLAGLDVLLDGAPVGQTRGRTFYRLELPPGDHLVVSRNPRDGSQHEQRVHAGSGSLVFLEQRVSMGATSMRHELVPAEQANAMKRIQGCRLLVSA